LRRRFFVERFEGASAVLRGEAAHHLGRVLRAAPGQLYELSDGQAVWLARTERVRRDAIDFALVERVPAFEPRLRVTLLLALVKFDRFEWSLEKATELGAAEIVPLAAARCEKALVSAAAKRAARWQKILIESAQQARRLRPPALHPAAQPNDAFTKFAAPPRALGTPTLLLSERPDGPPLREVLQGKSGPWAALAVGPEGGWTDAELAAARAAGFVETSLGGQIMRTETAVVAALAILNYALGDSAGLD